MKCGMAEQQAAAPMGIRGSTLAFAAFGLLVVISGVRAALLEPTLADLLLSLTLAVGLATWCTVDARRHGTPMPGAVPLVMVLTWPVAVPVYLLWSRGWVRGGVAAAGFVMALILLFMGSFLLAEHWIPG